jgi:hypothetical protein
MNAEQKRLSYMLTQVATLQSVAKIVQDNTPSMAVQFWTHELQSLFNQASVLLNRAYTIQGIYEQPKQ